MQDRQCGLRSEVQETIIRFLSVKLNRCTHEDMRRTLFDSGRYEELTNDDRLIYIPSENVDEHVELFANNNAPERRHVELTFGGHSASVRIEDVVSLPMYGDVLCDDVGEIGVFLSAPKRTDIYGLSAISSSDGTVALPSSVRVGDVICVDADKISHYAVIVHSGDNAITNPALPDGEFQDWRLFTRMDHSNYRKGMGVLTFEGNQASCSCRHCVVLGDQIVADVGGRPCLFRVEHVIDEGMFVVSGTLPVSKDVEWWHIPSTQELLLSLTCKEESMRRLQPGVQLKKNEKNAFGESSVFELCGRVSCVPMLQLIAEENVMKVTLRPNQRTRILPNICIGTNGHGVLSCKADKIGVTVGGYVCAALNKTTNLVLR